MLAIRRLNPGEWQLYRDIRLASLQDSPEAFSTTYESAAQRTPESWAAQADGSAEGSGPDRFTFLAFMDGSPIALAALYRDPGSATQGEIIQAWVAPSHRSNGVGAQLLRFIFQVSREHGLQKLRAEVRCANPRAVRFYQKHGFTHPTAMSAAADESLVLVKEL